MANADALNEAVLLNEEDGFAVSLCNCDGCKKKPYGEFLILDEEPEEWVTVELEH